jgi:NitT/TauT family transport system substrate-binding protein
MQKSKTVAIAAAVLIFIAVLGLLRHHSQNKPRTHDKEDFHKPLSVSPNGRNVLTVAFLPVTCHLTCPVTDYASKTSTTGTEFDAMRFGEFPSIVEALKSKKLLAGFITVPLAMKMVEQGAPVKICCLGHRDGSEVTIRKEDPAKSMADMRGKTIAIPSPFSNENFLLNKLMRDQGLSKGDIKTVVIPPPDMTAALAAKSIDGFVVAEPFCGKAEMDGYGRVLYFAKDVWPNYISCCLVVHQDLINENPAVVKDLVRGIIASGEWAQKNRADAAKLVSPKQYLGQNIKLLNYVLTQQPPRVNFVNLNPTDAELQRIMDMGQSLGFLKKKTPMSSLIDRQFIGTDIPAATIDMSRMAEITKTLEKPH